MIVEDRDVTPANPEIFKTLLVEWGFVHSTALLYPISRENAAVAIAHLVAYDQAYELPTGAFAIADDCGAQFVGLFPSEARFFTNSPNPSDSSAHSWNPITRSTFDCGVIAISPTRVGVVWFEDED